MWKGHPVRAHMTDLARELGQLDIGGGIPPWVHRFTESGEPAGSCRSSASPSSSSSAARIASQRARVGGSKRSQSPSQLGAARWAQASVSAATHAAAHRRRA